MPGLIHLDGRVVTSARAALGAAGRGVLHGLGAFTTLRVCGGRGFQMTAHMERLEATLEALRIPAPAAVLGEYFVAALAELSRATGLRDGVARCSVHAGSGPPWGAAQPSGSASVEQKLVLLRPVDPEEPALLLGDSSWPLDSRSPLCGHKSLSYAEPVAALAQARTQGLGEAVRRNERGEVAGACQAALAWVRDGRLEAPPRIAGGVRSTTLQWLESCAGGGLQRIALPARDLVQAEEILVLSAGRGIRAVVGYRGRELPGTAGAWFQRVKEAYHVALSEPHCYGGERS